MTKTRLLARVGLGGFVLAAAMATTPAVASADPVTEFLCSSGSAHLCPAVPTPPSPAVPPVDPIADLLCGVGLVQFCPLPPATPPAPAPAPRPAPAPAPGPSAFQYKNCTEARDAGAAPVYRGDYGYGQHLDRDNDGIGCE